MTRRAPPPPAPLPLDVRLMNATAAALLALTLLAALGAALLAWARHPMWTLRKVIVEGEAAHQNEVTIRALVLPHLRGTFLTLDLQAVRERFEALPWVREARVQRQFPHTLRVTLREHEPLAWWGERGGGRLVSVHGAIFDADPDEAAADAWPVLAGPPEEAEALVAMLRRVAPLVQRLGRDVERLELSPRGSWRLVLDGDAPLELGRGDEAALARLATFVTTHTALRARYGARDIVAADLRYPDGYAVRLRGVSTRPELPPPARRGAAAAPAVVTPSTR
ncbi:Cell division protein FtsQ [Tepidimonas alkaliphilus]|uniref:Cell division protein FtsQ n=1 Tax=Tepidimonas alkaliphilus TaxID=2588942 RepID=A0A554W949_9BURK|nr:FtsQ-type POTRA domain-containing protein [Tepidimonas alkaliphilus]TSE20099.1 Cell division protein FtsQ [Tepidimonas alkaliphilus]